MSDFPFTLRNMVQNGLRRSERDRNGLLSMYNLVPSDSGAEAYERLNQITANVSWPFPMAHQSDTAAHLLYETALYELDTTDWSSVLLQTYNPEHPNVTKPITGSDIWHFLSFFDTWMATNGTSLVFKTNLEGFTGKTNRYYCYNESPVSSLCALPGRAIYGGFDNDTFWNEAYKELWNRTQSTIDDATHLSLGMPSNSVAWTTIGGGDLLWPVLPEVSIYGPNHDVRFYDLDSTFLDDMISQNLFGFMPMPWRGTVLRILQIAGNNCIVYGDNGIALLFGIESGTFGMRKLARFGIGGRGCACAGINTHVFISGDARLYVVNSEFQIQELGYQAFMEELDLNETIITYWPDKKWFIISDDAQAFVLSQQGLGEASELVTSILEDAGSTYGVTSQKSSTTAVLLTDSFNMGNLSKKRIPLIHADYDNGTDMQARLYTKYDKEGSFETDSLTDLNKEGVSHHFVGGVEFRYELRGTVSPNFRLNDIFGRWQSLDSRYFRGVPRNDSNAN